MMVVRGVVFELDCAQPRIGRLGHKVAFTSDSSPPLRFSAPVRHRRPHQSHHPPFTQTLNQRNCTHLASQASTHPLSA